jgi:hypothetical protein
LLPGHVGLQDERLFSLLATIPESTQRRIANAIQRLRELACFGRGRDFTAVYMTSPHRSRITFYIGS